MTALAADPIAKEPLEGDDRIATNPEPISAVRILRATLCLVWKLCGQTRQRMRNRSMHVAETISLGDKRFVSILEVDGMRFLLGESATSMVLLAKLQDATTGMFRYGDLTAKADAHRFATEVPNIGNKLPGVSA